MSYCQCFTNVTLAVFYQCHTGSTLPMSYRQCFTNVILAVLYQCHTGSVLPMSYWQCFTNVILAMLYQCHTSSAVPIPYAWLSLPAWSWCPHHARPCFCWLHDLTFNACVLCYTKIRNIQLTWIAHWVRLSMWFRYPNWWFLSGITFNIVT